MKTNLLLILIIFFLSCSPKKETVNFEKIVFHTSPCFGNCTIINLQVNKDRSLLLSKKKNSIMPKLINPENSEKKEEYEYFKGKINDMLYDQLLTELAKTDTVSFKGINCCDAPLKTIIAYYNGKRKYIETMFPPKEGENLISILYQISQTENLVKTTEKIEFEYKASR
jgi:hypothetical protein